MNPAAWKFIGLFVDIVTYEVRHSNDGLLLSEEADRWIEKHPIAARIAIVSTGALLTLHLANLLAPEVDPLGRTVWRYILRRDRIE